MQRNSMDMVVVIGALFVHAINTVILIENKNMLRRIRCRLLNKLAH